MALTPSQQTMEQIQRASRILLVTKERPDRDALAATVGFLLFLKGMGKQVDAVAPGVTQAEIPSFLPAKDQIASSPAAMRASHLILDVTRVPLGEMLYDVNNGTLDITVVPKSGEWAEKDVRFEHGKDRYDLIIALGAPDQRSLGAVARDHADFLYRTTIINIDSDAANEHWGQVNHVDLNAVAVSEVLYRLFDEWNRHAITADMATALLAGMISRTKSFRTKNVTPKTLAAAAQLVALGARREEIVHGLWRTRDVATLKLWGRVLTRLEHVRDAGIAWSVLTPQDLIETKTTGVALEDIVDELLTYTPEAPVIALFQEASAGAPSHVTLSTRAPFIAADLARAFGGSGTRDAAIFDLPKDKPFVESIGPTVERLRELCMKQRT